MPAKQEYDISLRAENGMRRGRTTGTCAAAAAKAAVLALSGQLVDEVEVTLPGGGFYLPVPIERVERLSDGNVRAEVIKDAGDDPDATDGATIFCLASQQAWGSGNSADAGIKLLAGEGVGVVTQPGIRVPIGEPAINPVPRKMILDAVREVWPAENGGLNIQIGCVDGEKIAKKTFNPRLGIVGGISILGTTGIVEPMSLAAYMASIEVYIRVALAQTNCIALLPSNIGISFARKLGLERKRIVQISNFLGFSLSAVQATLVEEQTRLEHLWVLGHPGKLAKVLDGHWDTHSRVSTMAMQAIARFARQQNLAGADAIAAANTVEAAIDLLAPRGDAQAFWLALENELAQMYAARVPAAAHVHVRLFSMDGQALSGRGQE